MGLFQHNFVNSRHARAQNFFFLNIHHEKRWCTCMHVPQVGQWSDSGWNGVRTVKRHIWYMYLTILKASQYSAWIQLHAEDSLETFFYKPSRASALL